MAGDTLSTQRRRLQQSDQGQGQGQGSALDEQVRQWLFDQRLLTAEQTSGPGWVAAAVAARGWRGHTALWLACWQGNLSFCQWFFEHGTAEDVRTVDKDGWTLMFGGCISGNLAVCQWLFEHGAAEDVRTADKNGWTPMLAACWKGHLAVCQWLLEHGAAGDVRTADIGGSTPMFAACGGGHLAVCQWLLEHGAAEDVRTASIYGNTPMSIACFRHRLPVCQWLIVAGGPTLLDNNQVRSSMYADDRAQLVEWVQDRLAFHQCFVEVVLFGTHKRSGNSLLWMMRGEVGLRMLVAQFLDVPVKRELRHLRGALEVLKEIA